MIAAGGANPYYRVTAVRCPTSLDPTEAEGVTVACGRIDVPEDHGDPDGRRIDLTFMVLKSHSLSPAADPVVPSRRAGFRLQWTRRALRTSFPPSCCRTVRGRDCGFPISSREIDRMMLSNGRRTFLALALGLAAVGMGPSGAASQER
jgi:hypothetical protein